MLTRYLAPQAYGEVMLGSACVIVTMRTVAVGSGTYLITRHTSPEDSFHALLLQTALASLSLFLLNVFREPIAAALGAPGSARHIPGLALAGLIAQMAVIPAATLSRDLRFEAPAVARVAGEAAYTGVAVALVPLLGASAIVAGNLARSALSGVLLVFRSDVRQWWAPVWPEWPVVKRQVSFGLPLTGSGIAETVSSYGDNLIVANLYGPAVMGSYSLAFNVATTPTSYLAEQAGDVMLPGLAAVADPERRRLAFQRSLAVLTLLVFPLAFGLAVTAPTVVAVFLDRRWAPVAPMITILAGIAAARTIGTATFPLLLANGRSRTVLALALLRATLLLVLILTVGRLGPLWACASAALAAIAAHMASVFTVARSEGVDLTLMLRLIRPAFVASLVMIFGVLAARATLLAGAPLSWVALAVETAVGAFCYIATARLMAPKPIADVAGLLRALVVSTRSSAQVP